MANAKEFYNSRIAAMESSSLGFHHRVVRIIQDIQIGPIKRHMDIGSGDCALTKDIKDRIDPGEVLVVDIKEELIDTAKSLGMTAYVQDLDTKPLPAESDSIDFITCFETIEHLYNTDHLLSEINRILKTGGYLVLSTPNLASWDNRLKILFGFQPRHAEISLQTGSFGSYRSDKTPNGLTRASGHIRAYTLRALQDQVRYHRLTIERSFGYGDRFSFSMPSIAKIIIIVARKFSS